MIVHCRPVSQDRGKERAAVAHTPLILNQAGRKLSKRDGVTSVNDFRGMGYTADALANYMTLLGWSPPEGMEERFSLTQAAEVFGFERVNKAGARFDWDKLNWLNGQVLHELGREELLKRLIPLWQDAGFALAECSEAWCLQLCELIGPSLTLLADGVDQAKPFFVRPELQDDAKGQLEVPGAREALGALLKLLPEGPLGAEEAKPLLAQACESAGVKKGVLMKSLRGALLGQLQGPDLMDSWLLLHTRGEDGARISRCLG